MHRRGRGREKSCVRPRAVLEPFVSKKYTFSTGVGRHVENIKNALFVRYVGIAQILFDRYRQSAGTAPAERRRRSGERFMMPADLRCRGRLEPFGFRQHLEDCRRIGGGNQP